MFQPATVTAVDTQHNLVQIQYMKTNAVSQFLPPLTFGNALSGIQYAPVKGDIVLCDDSDGRHLYIIAGYVAPQLLQKTLKLGELIIFSSGGASIKLNDDGSISLMPKAGMAVKLGDGTQKKLALDGDSVTVSGTDSNGDTVNLTGHIVASSTQATGN